MDSNNINDIKPYEKGLIYGFNALTDSELLAVIIKTGTKGKTAIQLANIILSLGNDKEGLLGLINLSVKDLQSIKGVGKVKAIQIKCLCELSRRIAKTSATVRLDFCNPQSVADYYMEDLRHRPNEHLVVAFLDSKCKLIKDCTLTIGTVNASLITPREIFIEALKCNTVGIILIHNHPSGDASPSNNDISVTKRVKDAGELIGINLIDHIIIGDKRYTSLKEKGIL